VGEAKSTAGERWGLRSRNAKESHMAGITIEKLLHGDEPIQ